MSFQCLNKSFQPSFTLPGKARKALSPFSLSLSKRTKYSSPFLSTFSMICKLVILVVITDIFIFFLRELDNNSQILECWGLKHLDHQKLGDNRNQHRLL